MSLKLAVVTASIDPDRTGRWWRTWRRTSTLHGWPLYVVLNCPGVGERRDVLPMEKGPFIWLRHEGIGGVVPMFRLGVQAARLDGADVVACLHDDVQLFDQGWDKRVLALFESMPKALLAGWSGARGIGDDKLAGEEGKYLDFEPSLLVRRGFFSNMIDAEAHGERRGWPCLSACADGFSQIGRADWLEESFKWIEEQGVVHHAYDTMLGCMAARATGEVWFLPEKCLHAGGQTSVGDGRYAEWAEKKYGGDSEVWMRAHRVLWENFKEMLPFWVEAR